jgi:hypothetical protein
MHPSESSGNANCYEIHRSKRAKNLLPPNNPTAIPISKLDRKSEQRLLTA